MMPDQDKKARQKKFYTAQRVTDEKKAKGGDKKAKAELTKIDTKLGASRTGNSADFKKPGASEGEQMSNLAMGLGGLGDIGGVVARGIGRVMEDVASHQALS